MFTSGSQVESGNNHLLMCLTDQHTRVKSGVFIPCLIDVQCENHFKRSRVRSKETILINISSKLFSIRHVGVENELGLVVFDMVPVNFIILGLWTFTSQIRHTIDGGVKNLYSRYCKINQDELEQEFK